jgi:superfamily II DNA helicase RecQ
LAVLPTGYGKSLVYHVLYSLLAEKKKQSGVLKKTVIIVVFPLNSLIQDQLQKINRIRQRAVVLSVKRQALQDENDAGERSLDFTNIDKSRLHNADYEYIFTHPETCLSSKEGVSFFRSNVYKNSVAAIVVDEAHCILEW